MSIKKTRVITANSDQCDVSINFGFFLIVLMGKFLVIKKLHYTIH